jgi:hypothetical protein
MLAHGCEYTNTRYEVPKDCGYITFTECGLPIPMEDRTKITRLYSAFSDEHYVIPMKDPIGNKENFNWIKRNLGNDVNMHFPPSSYKDLQYSPTLIYTEDITNTYYFIERIGLYRLGANLFFKDSDGTPNTILKTKSRSITKKDIETILEGSWYPTYKKDILPYLNPSKDEITVEEINTILKKYSIKQSELFEMNPGIYYNIACRNPCHTNVSDENIRRGRAHSFNSETALIKSLTGP